MQEDARADVLCPADDQEEGWEAEEGGAEIEKKREGERERENNKYTKYVSTILPSSA